MNKLNQILSRPSFLAIACAGIFGMCTAQAQNIAVVNGEPIPKAKMDIILQSFKKDAAQQGQAVPPDLEKNVREHLIQRTINAQHAKSLKLHLSPEYAEKLDDARAAILTQLLFEHYKNSHPISDKAARAEYDRIVKETPANAQTEYRARHILVKTKAQAQKILKQLQLGKNFAQLAQKYSSDPGSAAQGGDLNWAVAGYYVPEFATALSALKKGQVTPRPVKTNFGYHIIKLEDTRTSKPPAFGMVKEHIKQKLQQNLASEFKQYLAKLRKNAHIQ